MIQRVTQGVDRDAVSRRRVRIRGVVQGVGFRPFVYSLASELSLTGSVWNDPDGVLAEVQGERRDVEEFCTRVRCDAPPLSSVEDVSWEDVDPVPAAGFEIAGSQGGEGRTLVPADVATCDACLAELRDPADRRHRHPFITCTACGPRFTIVTGLPYDRPMTTMAPFPMCPQCQAEYEDPHDRRFHAQPICCHVCGPVLELSEGPPRGGGVAPPSLYREAALERAREVLATGGVLAVKGLGGYHLACDATNADAVERLRDRKRRGAKPFAVMLTDVEAARLVCLVDDVEAGLLTSARRPIVLLRRRPAEVDADGAEAEAGLRIVDGVAPGNPDLGVLLPPTALHHLLLGLPGDADGPRALVLTSGNLASEPIVTDDADARRRLGGLADAWLHHDRGIHVPCDDSVVRVVEGAVLPIRRSRGYAPMPVALPVDVRPSLAVGGDLKNTFCVAEGRYAWLSAHIGDMDDLATQEAFAAAVTHLATQVDVSPQVLVADLHPAYRSARWAVRESVRDGRARPLVRVQHHHAHVASVMAEHGLDGSTQVIGFAFDGTGFGDDGAVWGGEVLLADYRRYRRFAHLAYVPLPGGDAAVQRPYRMALAHLDAAGVAWDGDIPAVAACSAEEREVAPPPAAHGPGQQPDVEHGPTLRRDLLDRRSVPRGGLRGPGRHGAGGGGPARAGRGPRGLRHTFRRPGRRPDRRPGGAGARTRRGDGAGALAAGRRGAGARRRRRRPRRRQR